MMVTPIYAAALAAVLVLLSVRTLRLRRRFQVAVGTGDEPTLMRAIRAQGNFCEYVPLGLLMLFFLESHLDGTLWIHILGASLLVGRGIHAYGLSQVDEDYRFRVGGMMLTLTPLSLTAVALLIVAVAGP